MTSVYEQETAALERMLEGLDDVLRLMPVESEWRPIVFRQRASVLVALGHRRLRPARTPEAPQPHSEAERQLRAV